MDGVVDKSENYDRLERVWYALHAEQIVGKSPEEIKAMRHKELEGAKQKRNNLWPLKYLPSGAPDWPSFALANGKWESLWRMVNRAELPEPFDLIDQESTNWYRERFAKETRSAPTFVGAGQQLKLKKTR